MTVCGKGARQDRGFITAANRNTSIGSMKVLIDGKLFVTTKNLRNIIV